jgi:hypothetical protein
MRLECGLRMLQRTAGGLATMNDADVSGFDGYDPRFS